MDAAWADLRRRMSSMSRIIVLLAGLLAFQAGAAGGPSLLHAQIIKGMVFDDDTGAPLQGAAISVLSADFKEVIQGRADAMGRFRYLLPDSGIYLISAIESGYATSAPEVLVLGKGEEVTVMLSLWSLDPQPEGVSVRESETGGMGADVYGQVVELETGQPITNVEVRVEGQSGSAVTDVNGRFFIRDVAGSGVKVLFNHLSYAPRETVLTTEAGVAYELAVQMEPEPLELPGIVVSTTPRGIARRLEPVFARMDAYHELIAPYAVGPEGESAPYTFLRSPEEFENSLTLGPNALKPHLEARHEAVNSALAEESSLN